MNDPVSEKENIHVSQLTVNYIRNCQVLIKHSLSCQIYDVHCIMMFIFQNFVV